MPAHIHAYMQVYIINRQANMLNLIFFKCTHTAMGTNKLQALSWVTVPISFVFMATYSSGAGSMFPKSRFRKRQKRTEQIIAGILIYRRTYGLLVGWFPI